MKIAYFLILFASLLALLTVGCNSAGETSGIEDIISNESTQSTLVSVSDPYFLEVSFPDGAPALNQVAQLKVVAVHKGRIVNDVQIEVILPEGFILVSGELSWSIDSLPYGGNGSFNCTGQIHRDR